MDGLVVVAVVAAAYLAWAVLRFMISPLRFHFPHPSWTVIVTAAVVVLVIYLSTAWVVAGRTYGDLLMGLRVLGPRGHRLRPFGALVRALACAVFPIGLLWCAVNPSNRSLQDVVLRTSVVYDWLQRAAPSRPQPVGR